MIFVDVMMMTHDQILFYYNLEAKLVWLIRAELFYLCDDDHQF